MKGYRIAVILLNYNSSSDCQKCIGFLKIQEDVDMEIIIVDNCSHDEDCLASEKLCQELDCTFIANTENKGYNAGNNVGLRYAAEKEYEYALIANPDMEFPQADYLKRMLDVMELDEHIAVCGSDIITPEGIHQSPMKRDGNWRESFRWFTGILKKPKNTYDFIDHYESSHFCHKVSGCCLMVRMSFIKEIGYFDEYPFLYCEEAILSKQVEQSNKWKMYYTTDAQAVHRHIKNEKGNPIKRFHIWQQSRLYFIDKYSEDPWWGKALAKLSMRFQVFTISMGLRIKNLIRHG
jgi:GT2 family glycosyltransferase